MNEGKRKLSQMEDTDEDYYNIDFEEKDRRNGRMELQDQTTF